MPLDVQCYVKAGCHLCDVASDILDDLSPLYDLRVTYQDILDDSTLYILYRYRVPVVMVNNTVIVEGHISREPLQGALAGLSSDTR